MTTTHRLAMLLAGGWRRGHFWHMVMRALSGRASLLDRWELRNAAKRLR